MKKFIIGFLSLGLVATGGVLTTSCEDMMTVDTGDKIYQNANDTLYSYLGIMKSVQNLAERYVVLGELRGDLLSPTEYMTDTLTAIANFEDPADGSCTMVNITDYYNVINQCNIYIHYCDTSAVKSNVKYMLPEFALVQGIRAWTYLQLVENYGEVPFITEPVTSLGVISNFDYSNNLANKDNLVDLLIAEGLENYINTEYPSYGSWNNGAVSISARLGFFPIRILLGDLYLLRGGSTSDYEKAAGYYYDYLKNLSTPMATEYCTASKSRLASITGNDFAYSSANGWGTWGTSYTYSASQELITAIPSSANKSFGTMLTRVASIMGYTPTSSTSNEATTNDDDEEEASESGAIRVTANYKAQVTPSNAYSGLSDAQTYVNYESSTSSSTVIRNDYIDAGDARYNFATSEVTYEGDAYPLAAKASRGSTFYYNIPVYRKTLVWLRLAEALNRAGYPEYAFGILKDGLNEYTMPTMQTTFYLTPKIDENGDTVYNSRGRIVNDTVYYRAIKYNSTGAMYHLTDTTKIYTINNILPSAFRDNVWQNTFGIHAKGSGYGSWSTTSEGVRRTNLIGYTDSLVYTYDNVLKSQGVDRATASQAEIINAIENVIVDELALETSFEGNRFTDLVRIAYHKNNAGYDGTSWLANKIACRGMRQSKDDSSITIGSRDESLYSKLSNTSYWYLTVPAWSVR